MKLLTRLIVRSPLARVLRWLLDTDQDFDYGDRDPRRELRVQITGNAYEAQRQLRLARARMDRVLRKVAA